MRKKIRYKSNNGLKFEFSDKAPYFAEKIDAASISGEFSVDTLAGTVGQFTTSKSLSGRTITCEFAVVFNTYEMRLFKKQIIERLIECFNPTVSGTITIITDTGDYEIECYPAEIPKFDNSEVSFVYRFTVDFICDYPYFCNTKKHKIMLEAEKIKIIKTQSIINIPFKIINENFSGLTLTNNTTKKELRLKPFGGGGVIYDTKTLTLTTKYGQDVSQFIDITSDFDEFYLKYGNNELISNANIEIVYQNYALGVI